VVSPGLFERGDPGRKRLTGQLQRELWLDEMAPTDDPYNPYIVTIGHASRLGSRSLAVVCLTRIVLHSRFFRLKFNPTRHFPDSP